MYKRQYRYHPLQEPYSFNLTIPTQIGVTYNDDKYTNIGLKDTYRFIFVVEQEGLDQIFTTCTPEEYHELTGVDKDLIKPLYRELSDSESNKKEFGLATLNAVLGQDSEWKGQIIESSYIDNRILGSVTESDTHRGRIDNPHNVTANQIQDFDDNVNELLHTWQGNIGTQENPVGVINTLGTIETGVWEGSKIDRDFLDLGSLGVGENAVRPEFPGVTFTNYNIGNLGIFNTGDDALDLNGDPIYDYNSIEADIHVKTFNENAIILELSLIHI